MMNQDQEDNKLNSSTILTKIQEAASLTELEELKVKFLGKSGLITESLKKIALVPKEEKKSYGESINKIKIEVEEALRCKKEILQQEEEEKKLESTKIDLSIPYKSLSQKVVGDTKLEFGKIHPITKAKYELISIFSELGFEAKEGPNIEDEWHNFSALNVPENHPARQMHDTFYLNALDEKGEKLLLRTHTSPIQIRTMMHGKPPFKFICHGKTFRCDLDATHTPMFHQMEGVLVDEDTNIGHLKWTIEYFLKRFFETDKIHLRFRPSYFPFTEPSMEVDIGCSIEDGVLDLREPKRWLEILGCGMVHPNVLQNVGHDTKIYQGFAFGMGIERLAMLKYGITDIRSLYDNEAKWIEHFSFNFTSI